MNKIAIVGAAVSLAAALAAVVVLHELRQAVLQVARLDKQMEVDHAELVKRVIAANQPPDTGPGFPSRAEVRAMRGEPFDYGEE